MPRAPRRCPGDNYQCPNLIRGSAKYCPAHSKSWTGPRTASSKITRTTAWRKLRQQVLTRDHYQCQERGPTCIGYATEVDHTGNITSGGAVLDPANARAICAPCHLVKTQTEARRGRNQWKRQPERHPGLLP